MLSYYSRYIFCKKISSSCPQKTLGIFAKFVKNNSRNLALKIRLQRNKTARNDLTSHALSPFFVKKVDMTLDGEQTVVIFRPIKDLRQFLMITRFRSCFFFRQLFPQLCETGTKNGASNLATFDVYLKRKYHGTVYVQFLREKSMFFLLSLCCSSTILRSCATATTIQPNLQRPKNTKNDNFSLFFLQKQNVSVTTGGRHPFYQFF